MITELFLVLAAVTAWWLYAARLPPDYPPMPPVRLPFLGHMHYLLPHLREPYEGLYQLYDKYGRNGVMAMHFGPYKFVLLDQLLPGDHQLVRDMFRRDDTNTRCEDRELGRYMELLRGTLNYGIVNGVGKKWQEQSRFMTTALREFGFGKSGVEEVISEEVGSFKSYLETQCDQTIYFHNIFNIAILNVIWVMVSGERFQYTDPKMKELVRLISDVTASLNLKPSIGFVFPTLRDIFPSVDYLAEKSAKMQAIKSYLRRAIQMHKDTYEDGNIRDFIDAYIRKVRETTDVTSSFHPSEGYDHLVDTLIDLFVAGSETSSSTLSHGILFMIRRGRFYSARMHPEIQEEVRDELHKVVGTNRQPTLADRANLPFTDATVMEIQRVANVLPVGLPHAVSSESLRVGPYSVPRGHTLIGNFGVLLKGEKWSRGSEFRPERFIGRQGRVERNENFIPFSVGKRACPGEHLARAELFLFLAGLLQTFRFEAEDPTRPPEVERMMGLTAMPVPFRVKITRPSPSLKHV